MFRYKLSITLPAGRQGLKISFIFFTVLKKKKNTNDNRGRKLSITLPAGRQGPKIFFIFFIDLKNRNITGN